MNQKDESFLDKNTIIAVVVVGLSWIGWQSYMNNKYGDLSAQPTVTEQAQNPLADGTETYNQNLEGSTQPQQTAPSPKIKRDEMGGITDVAENFVTYSDDNWSFTVSSKGMGIKDLQLKSYTDRKEEPMRIGQEQNLLTLATNVIGRRAPIDFAIRQVDDRQIYGEAFLRGMKIVKTIVVDSENYSLNTEVRVENVGDDFSGLVTQISDKVDRTLGGGSFFMPSFEHQEIYVKYDDTDDRLFVVPDDRLEPESFSKVKIAAIGTQYFTQAILDRSDVMPEFKGLSANDLVFGSLTHKILNRSDQFKIEYTSFIGPKKYELLSKLDENLAGVIDFGWFNSIAKYILFLMKYFYDLVGNWGVAVIILTIIVRILVLPFNIMSYKSMKAMSKIQPLLKEIQEKYKDDPMEKNQRTMALMKEHKANPLGGCLPMLLQIPIFFALYRVLGSSIDLYKAPLGLWIQDLSLKDPYYVLPILMGLTFFIQQKITPTTMDANQKKIMMFMPIFFTILMVSLPSGLTLYIFVSALFGVLQQFWFMRDRKPEPQPA